MELSGLIFVALALVWAVVLLPKALRHHDELAQTRSVDGLSESMRVLARREAVSEREARLVVTPPIARTPAPLAAPAPAPVAPVAPAGPVAATREPMTQQRVKARIAAQRRAAASAARRRRLILVALLLGAVGTGITAGLGTLPLWSVAVPGGLVLAFLVAARLLVRRERARWDAELRELKARTVAADAAADQPVASAADSDPDDTSSFPLGLLADVEPTTDAGSLWDPLPVTLPTYVGKPRASRSVRTIDLQAPGVSSSGHDAASSALVADAATSPPPEELPQRAVGS